MLTKFKVFTTLASAAAKGENRFDDGTINWNFVSADAYIDLMPHGEEERDLIDTMLDQFADAWEYKTTVGVRPNFA